MNENSTQKSKTINHMISNNLVPIQKSNIYKLLQRFYDGNPIKDDLYAAGRRRLLQEDDINFISLKLNDKSGSTIAMKEIKDVITSRQLSVIDSLGYNKNGDHTK